ncbi:monovalent cation/H+ antiporter subunit D [Devosia sp.]|uniref:monovalent cation/H+ antiporter subunit D n=1 Tax=Devosia sp. TaxID=1871048 RepID=UPI001AC15FD5|nr:monovalent cation/H+ antiporter subunit D [Devosia sp.]MBN9309286.1 monovalent cation/H+ antiporter subunit D [Devosia sp.]
MEQHLAVLPIVLPLLAGAALVLIEDRHHTVKLVINIVATLLLVATGLVLLAGSTSDPARIIAYQIGDWPAPYGIVLVVDRLSALMVALTSVLALGAIIFSAARWHRAGQHFHSLFQLLLMGLNGAFLTGDLFNLFVFFEVMLAASYGLALHGSGRSRVKASLHYITMNLATSSLFLIGATAIYGVAGTLNMADLAVRIPLLSGSDLALLQTGAAILGIAFLVKAGMWPLGMWLPTTYAAAAPPVAAMFAIMSKVGVYVVMRLTSLLFGEGSGASAHFGDLVLQYGGLATIAFGTVGVLASQGVARIACFSVIVSSGTLLAVNGYENAGVTAGALYYLVSSTLGLSCLFLLVELMERGRSPGDDVLAVTLEAYGDDEDPEHEQEVGVATPGSFAALGVAFACCAILIAGMPPLSGFLGKFAIIHALFGIDGGAGIATGVWVLAGALIVSGLAATVALMRTGINTFWVSLGGSLPAIRWVEITPVVLLLGLGVTLTVYAQPVMDFMQAAATSLHAPGQYTQQVLGDLHNGARP